MRFRSLTIEKYGVFPERTIALPAEPGLILLYGPNEAGKSTCLAAICDFLFGIPHNSPHGQVFGYDQMRLSATLSLADGTTVSLRRRKGRHTRSLSDGEGRHFDEAVLSRCLGATGRERFSTLFGIDHASLRSGGNRLLEADGDVGRLIVEAGGGLRVLVDAMELLKTDAERHFSARRSAERLFYKALDRFEAAEQQVRSGTLTREAFDRALERQRDALEIKEALRARHREAGEQALRLQRLVRVVPVLRQLEATDKELAGFDDLAALAVDFPAAAHAALRVLEVADLALREAEERQLALTAKLNAIDVPASLMDAEATICDVVEKAVTVRKARTDRTNRQKELTDSETKLDAARARMGLPSNADLDTMMPGSSIIERAQRLANHGLELRVKIATASEQRSSDGAELEHLRQCQADRACLGTTTPLGISTSDLAPLPSAQAELDEKSRQAAESLDGVGKRLAALGFTSLEELAEWQCPDAQVVQAEIEARNALELEIAKFADRIAAEMARRDGAEAEIVRLTGVGSIPSATAVAAARQARDETWAAIRELYVNPEISALSARPLAHRSDDALALERRTREADHLADRKSAEAERLATLELLARQCTEARVAAAAFASERVGLERRKLSMDLAWLETWPGAARRFGDLGILKGIVEGRQSIFTQAATIEAADRALKQLQVDLAPRLAALAAAEQQLGIVPDASRPLADRVQSAISAIRAHEDAYSDFRRDDAAIRDLMLRITKTEASLRDQQEALARWQVDWTDAVRPLALGGDEGPERASEVATLWATSAGILRYAAPDAHPIAEDGRG